MGQLLRVATGDFEFVKNELVTFNASYRTEMTYVDSVCDDGVNFGIIDVGNTSIDEIYLFGFHTGAHIQKLRSEKKINW